MMKLTTALTIYVNTGKCASNPPFPIRVAFCIGPVGEEIEFFSGEITEKIADLSKTGMLKINKTGYIHKANFA